MLKVRIIKCSDNDYWYKDQVGADLFVGYKNNDDYFFKGGVGGGLIAASDCQIIECCREDCKNCKKEITFKCLSPNTIACLKNEFKHFKPKEQKKNYQLEVLIDTIQEILNAAKNNLLEE